MENNISWGISGNKQRIFISAALGCHYNCTYCYLKQMKIQGIQEYFQKKELLDEVEQRGIFIPGERGSLVTIGCFTECWDEKNRKTTIDIINFFLKHGNYIQISTKKKIYDKDIVSILENIQFSNQMNIFVSLPTLSYAKELEPGIDSPDLRIENFDIKRKYGINTYLYIKPVLEEITIKDKEKYAEIVKQYQIPAIIGDIMYPVSKNSGKGFCIGNTYMHEYRSSDSDELAFFLGQYTSIFRHSDDAIKQMRKGLDKEYESKDFKGES